MPLTPVGGHSHFPGRQAHRLHDARLGPGDRKELRKYEGHSDGVNQREVLPRHQRIVSTSYDGTAANLAGAAQSQGGRRASAVKAVEYLGAGHARRQAAGQAGDRGESRRHQVTDMGPEAARDLRQLATLGPQPATPM